MSPPERAARALSSLRVARLANIDLPDFGMPEAMPVIPPALYAGRLERLRERADAQRYGLLRPTAAMTLA